MGQGGRLLLVNYTPYNWTCQFQRSHMMHEWSYPRTIAPGTASEAVIKWGEGFLWSSKTDIGRALYTLDGTQHTFEIKARNSSDGYNLQVELCSFATTGNPRGSFIQLGWKHDDFVYFILSGREGQFNSSNPPISWMQSNLSALGPRSLRRLCIPGSHNSGMSCLNSCTLCAKVVVDGCIITQRVPISKQLEFGVRYLDCRPVMSAGRFFAGYYRDVPTLGWQGGNGESFEEIISDINTFTETYKELVILNLSHDLNSDVELGSPLNQAEWDRLLGQLIGDKGLNHLFFAPNSTSVDLTTLPLNQFIGDNQAAVLIIAQPTDHSVILGDYHHRGAYNYSQMNAFKSHSHTHNLDVMASNQLQKMRDNRTSPDSPLFLLSWTLTPDPTKLLIGTSILKVAEKALRRIYTDLFPACSNNTYPNILYLNGLHNSDITALAMAINSFATMAEDQNGRQFPLPPPPPQTHVRESREHFGMFSHSSHLHITGGQFGQFTQAMQQATNGIKQLAKAAVPAAIHNHLERFHTRKCPATRTPVIDRIMHWVCGQEHSEALIMWLFGPADSGKSEIAQALAESCHGSGILLGSFFFSQDDPSRNNGLPLFATIVYQVVTNFPDSRDIIGRVLEKDPFLLTQFFEVQLHSLLISPLQQLHLTGREVASDPHLIIIDGLDQCTDPQVQVYILNSISNALKECQFPLKFLITSRPELHLTTEFDSETISPILSRLALEDKHFPDSAIKSPTLQA